MTDWRLRLRLLLRRCSAGWTAFEEVFGRLLEEWLTARHRLEVSYVEIRHVAAESLRAFDAALGSAHRHVRAREYEQALRAGNRAATALRSLSETVDAARALGQARSRYEEIVGALDLARFEWLLSLRLLRRVLTLAGAFLDAGEARKAEAVLRVFTHELEELLFLADGSAGQIWSKVRARLEVIRARVPGAAPTETGDLGRLEQLAESGHLRLAMRLAQDWMMETGEHSPERLPHQRDTRSLADALAALTRQAHGTTMLLAALSNDVTNGSEEES